MGALSTLFAITDRDGWDQKYDITVYQLGWRLGGKGGTGRDQKRANRILEHGYHMLFGFYDNIVRDDAEVLRRARTRSRPADVGARRVVVGSMKQALPAGTCSIGRTPPCCSSSCADGSWHNLLFDFPENTDLPGDAGELPHALAYIEMAVEFLARVVEDVTIGPAPAASRRIASDLVAATRECGAAPHRGFGPGVARAAGSPQTSGADSPARPPSRGFASDRQRSGAPWTMWASRSWSI